MNIYVVTIRTALGTHTLKVKAADSKSASAKALEWVKANVTAAETARVESTIPLKK